MEPYHYAESAPPKRKSKDGTLSEVAKITKRHELQPTPAEKADYDRVMNLYNRAKAAQARGQVDVDAVRSLSPSHFENQPHEEHEAIARGLSKNLAFSRDSALDRVTLQHPDGARFQKLDEILQAEPPAQHPRLIFAHNLDAVDAIAERLKAQGHRVATLKGNMDAGAKEAARDAYSPPYDSNKINPDGSKGGYVREPSADIMVASDAASVGMNAQRGARILQWDTPHTAMTYEQRTARSHRTGQGRDVVLDHLTMDVPHERRRLKNLATKGELREALTTPADRIDDSGLAHAIASAQERALQQHVQEQAGAKRGPLAKMKDRMDAEANGAAKNDGDEQEERPRAAIREEEPLSKGMNDSPLKGKHRVGGRGASHEGSHWEATESANKDKLRPVATSDYSGPIPSAAPAATPPVTGAIWPTPDPVRPPAPESSNGYWVDATGNATYVGQMSRNDDEFANDDTHAGWLNQNSGKLEDHLPFYGHLYDGEDEDEMNEHAKTLNWIRARHWVFDGDRSSSYVLPSTDSRAFERAQNHHRAVWGHQPARATVVVPWRGSWMSSDIEVNEPDWHAEFKRQQRLRL